MMNVDPQQIMTLAEQLAALLAPALPYLGAAAHKAGGKAVEEAGKKLGGDLWERSTKAWSALRGKVEERPEAGEAVAALAKDPEQPLARGMLELQLVKILQEEPALAAQLAPLVAGGGVHIATVQVETVNQNGSVAAGEGAVAASNELDGQGHAVATGPGARASSTTTIHQAAPPPGAPPAALREAYLHRLMREAGALALSGIDRAAAKGESEARLELGAIYTGLETQGHILRSEIPEVAEQQDAVRQAWEWGARQRDRDLVPALAQLDHNDRLVLLGDPGSGKSTFVSFLVLCHAGELLGDELLDLERLCAPLPDDAGDDREEPQPWRWGPLLPLWIVLRDFGAAAFQSEKDDEGKAGDGGTAEAVWHHVEEKLTEWELGDYAPHLRSQLLEEGGLILLDGFDEVPDVGAGGRRLRERMRDAVESFAATFHRCRILVTSRPYAYQEQRWRLPEFSTAELAPFGPGQLRRFVRRWYAHSASHLKLSEQEAAGRAALLEGAIFRSERLVELAERPLLLTLMASLHAWRKGSLPRERGRLYGDAVELLLDIWESDRVVRDADGNPVLQQESLAEYLKVDQEAVRRLLQEVAFEVHSAQPKLIGTADIDQRQLAGRLMELTGDEGANPAKVMRYLSERAGLLVPRGVGVLTFPHRSFQEYLAACHLTDQDFPELAADLARRDPDRYREVALLAAAKAGASQFLGLVWDFASCLCPHDPPGGADEAAEEELWGAHLASQVLVESGRLDKVGERHEPLVQRLRGWGKVFIASGLPARERVLAGDNLAALGDPREEVTSVAGMQFCWVPAGRFVMGSGEDEEGAYDDEKPQHEVDVAYGYWLGRFPVTVSQLREWVGETEFELGDEDALRGPASRPAVWVSWEEALSFCGWMSERLEAAGLPWRAVLPSEAEWEKGARGGLEVSVEKSAPVRLDALPDEGPSVTLEENPKYRQRYPWGDEFEAELANVAETGVGSSSAVGCFAGGASVYGCDELSGNVWEWTRSAWGKDWQEPDYAYPYDAGDGREDKENVSNIIRVLRGGAFFDYHQFAVCAFRYWYYPAFRGDYIGFRVALLPSSVL